jgi:hypothetical protein
MLPSTVLALAHALVARADVREWAIGGSAMLHLRGVIETLPRDLDIVTTVADFEEVCASLPEQFVRCDPAAHPDYASTRFRTFQSADGTKVDVMAGIAVIKNGVRTTWTFDSTRIEIVDGLPLMWLDDWLDLYTLFDRPQRVEQIESYLRRKRGEAVLP